MSERQGDADVFADAGSRRPFASRWLLAVIIPIVLFGAVEIALRGFGSVPPDEMAEYVMPRFLIHGEEIAQKTVVRHPTRFFALKPGYQGPLATDGNGFRGGEHPRHHRDLFRVALLGDSCTMGYRVRYGQSFAGRLEVALRELRPDLDIDVVNAGCGAYSTYQNRIDLDERVLPLKPDAVVLCLSGWNDVGAAVLMDDASWAKRLESSPGLASKLEQHSHLFAWLRRFLKPTDSQTAEYEFAEAMAIAGTGESGVIFRVDRESLIDNVSYMFERIRAAGAEPFLLVLRPRPGIEPIPQDCEKYGDATLELAREMSVPSTDAGEVLHEKGYRYFLDIIHPSSEGHLLIARALFDLLTEDAVLGIRDRDGHGDGEAPTLGGFEPSEGYAGRPLTATVQGTGFAGTSPRFYLNGDPLRLLAVEGDERARVEVSPMSPGLLDLEVQTTDGSARLEEEFRAVGPRLTIDEREGTLHITVTGGPGDLLRLVAGQSLEEEARGYGETLAISADRVDVVLAEVSLPESGRWNKEVVFDRSKYVDPSPTLVQAVVTPCEGPYPRIPLYSNLVEIAP